MDSGEYANPAPYYYNYLNFVPRFEYFNEPYRCVMPDGTVVANQAKDFFGAPAAPYPPLVPININEWGESVDPGFAWTNVTTGGNIYSSDQYSASSCTTWIPDGRGGGRYGFWNCSGDTTSVTCLSYQAILGDITRDGSTSHWTAGSVRPCSEQNHLYCFQQEGAVGIMQ